MTWGVRVADLVMSPLTLLAALWLRTLRRIGLKWLPVTRRVLFGVGLVPVRHHYYEPLFAPGDVRVPLDRPRALPGIDLEVPAQLALLERFTYQRELLEFPVAPAEPPRFGYLNQSFGAGDAEILYSVIRCFRPRRIVEIGSGMSTLMAAAAVKRNAAEDPAYACEHVCVEPYEMPWLESTGVRVLRQRVEDTDRALFAALGENDILFIDSSHVIRPQGDVVTEYLELLPALEPGVIVHVHDIYTPRDYPPQRLLTEVRFWDEQYLLEALMSGGRDFRVMLALHHLWREHPAALHAACPVLAQRPASEPGSWWMRKA
jgi:hypothetical protein